MKARICQSYIANRSLRAGGTPNSEADTLPGWDFLEEPLCLPSVPALV